MSNLPTAKELSELFSSLYQLPIDVRHGTEKGEPFVEFFFADLDKANSVSVRATVGWRSLVATTIAGQFSGNLIREMGRADKGSRLLFEKVAESLSDQGGKLKFTVNGDEVGTTGSSEWPGTWERLLLKVEKTPLPIDHDSADAIRRDLVHWAGGAVSMILALLPTANVRDLADEELQGFAEGAQKEFVVTRYERDPRNRASCITIYGTACMVCEVRLGERYGEIGEGFIHVHHLTPVSDIGEGYIIDPSTDLAPVCPNCHAMLHRRSPPYSLEELREIMV